MNEAAITSLRKIAGNSRLSASTRNKARDSLSSLGVSVGAGVDEFLKADLLPLPLLEEHDGIMIVRDDLLDGGSKRRFLRPLIESEGDEWCYASPRQGYGQISLAYVCRDLGKKATVFLAQSAKLHPYTEEAKLVGANIMQVPMGYRSHCEAVAREYVANNQGSRLAPFGFHCPLVVNEVARIARLIDYQPKEVWTILSSGTLSSGLQLAWPKAKFYGIYVGHLPTQDERGRAELLKAPEKYEQPAKILPPFPSAINYDAKAWRFIQKKAAKGALFWNVGK